MQCSNLQLMLCRGLWQLSMIALYCTMSILSLQECGVGHGHGGGRLEARA